ncbi:hypothetical protein R3W88_032224 [Solanum pinnatisectum]|uniref:Uncharacterized protein n=1 Tax=Solanum pinnatisectum TaxID=50273 RepID=A0AAV9LPV2_9SOLN|nr:hypothetical protein R3W88_032224 [Solanum pinnatisectum]
MALFNFCSCFSESSDSESSRFVCNGDVCVLRDPKSSTDINIKKKNKQKRSFRIQFSQISLGAKFPR